MGPALTLKFRTREMEKIKEEIGEIDERSVKSQVPEVELQVFRRGKGPIEVVKSRLGGYEEDQLDVGDILEKYGFKSIYAFNPESGRGRGLAIRFNPRNGLSVLTYRNGSVVYIDGEPKVLTTNYYLET